MNARVPGWLVLVTYPFGTGMRPGWPAGMRPGVAMFCQVTAVNVRVAALVAVDVSGAMYAGGTVASVTVASDWPAAVSAPR